MDAAADHLTADLEPHRATPIKKVLRWGLALLESTLGGSTAVAPMDLVVRRIDTGREVLRTYSDVGSPDFLLEQVRHDLATKTVEEFFAEWRLD